MAIYERIVSQTKQRGLRACIHCFSPAYAARMIAMGFNLVTIANDSGLLLGAAKAAVQATRKG
jgi:4-hydroxy-2-oxoheptanedioate aldolase